MGRVVPHTVQIIVVALLGSLVALLLLPALQSSARAEDGAASLTVVDPLEVEGYAADFNVLPSVAKERLEVQASGAGIVELLKRTLDSDYAGVWFDNSSGKFVIPTVPGADRSTLTQALEDLGLAPSSYRLDPARATWTELEAEQKQLLASLRDEVDAGRVTSSLDARRNGVLLRLSRALSSKAEAAVEHAAERSAVTAAVETLPDQRFQVGVEACTTIKPRQCDKPLRGGVEIAPKTNLGGGEYFYALGACTAGFKATGNVFGNQFMLSAGHCFAMAGNGTWASSNTQYTIKDIGPVEEYRFDGYGDWGKLNANGSWWSEIAQWPSTVAHYWGDQTYPINYEAWPYQGQYLCFSGNKSGTSCGAVTNLRVEGIYAENCACYLPPEFEVLGVCHEGGDSGGPLFSYSSNTAVGLLSAGDDAPCAESRSYFVEVTAAATNLGVTVGTRIGGPPSASTAAATGITGTQATANGTINPNAVETKYHFEFGKSISYGQSAPVPDASAGHGASSVGVSATVPGLEPATVYNYRLVANSAAGSSVGTNSSFETGPGTPVVTISAPTNRSATGATLNGTVNPRKAATSYQFEYGTTSAMGQTVPATPESVGSGKTPVAVSQSITGLKPETTYFYRIKATNSVGTTTGSSGTFMTYANSAAFGSSLGSLGSGNGQFNQPLGIATAAPGGGVPNGDVWVVDSKNNRVQRLNSKGEYLSQIGSAGTGNGQFSEPRAITVDSTGNLWVTDAQNHRVQKFDSNGQFLMEIDHEDLNAGASFDWVLQEPNGIAFGREGHFFISDPVTGYVEEFRTTPDGLGRYFVARYSGFGAPANMATDAEGDVWFLDSAQNRVYEIPFDSEYGDKPIQRFGTTGAAPGQLSGPYAVAVKPSGTLLISDRANNRVQQFTQSGEFIGSFGKAGNEPGDFCEPTGLALSSRGVIFVADSCHNKVQRWTQKTAPEAVTQPATNVTTTSATLNARINPSGLATTYSFEYGKTSSYGSSIPASPGSIAAGFEDSNVAVSLTGLVPETTYHRRIVATNAEGITYGKDRTFVTPSGTASYSSSFSSLGTGNGSLNRPLGMAAEVVGGVPTGNFWIVDNKNNRVVKVNSGGGFIRQVGGTLGTANGQFDSPRGVAVDDQGNIWVTDAGNHRIQEFNAKGEFLKKIVKETNFIGGFLVTTLETPSGIAIGREGHIFVGDQGQGGTIDELQTSPNGFGKYSVNVYTAVTNPTQMATDEDSDVWTIDYQDNKVYEIGDSGAPVLRFGTGGTGPGQLTAPYGIAVKPNGNILISNRGNNLIQQFSPSGTYQFQFGAGGSGPGQFSEPSQMVVGPDGSVYVADSGNNRVQRWTFK